MPMLSKLITVVAATIASAAPVNLTSSSGQGASLKRAYVYNNCEVDVEVGEWSSAGSEPLVVSRKSTADLPHRDDCPGGKAHCSSPICDVTKNDGPCLQINRFKWRQAHEEYPPAFDYMEMNFHFLGSDSTINQYPNFANWQGFNGIGMSIMAYKPGTTVPACRNYGGKFDPQLEECEAAGGKLYEGPALVPDKFKCHFPAWPNPPGGPTCDTPQSNYLKEHYWALQFDGDGYETLPHGQFSCPEDAQRPPWGKDYQRTQCYMEVGYWVEPTQPCFYKEPHQGQADRPGIGMWVEPVKFQEAIDVMITFCP